MAKFPPRKVNKATFIDNINVTVDVLDIITMEYRNNEWITMHADGPDAKDVWFLIWIHGIDCDGMWIYNGDEDIYPVLERDDNYEIYAPEVYKQSYNLKLEYEKYSLNHDVLDSVVEAVEKWVTNSTEE